MLDEKWFGLWDEDPWVYEEPKESKESSEVSQPGKVFEKAPS